MNQPEDFYKTIVETVHEAIWVSNSDDIIIFANRAMEELSGLERGELIGKNVLKDFPKETIRQFKRYYNQTKKSLRPIDYEAEVLTPGGRLTLQKGWLLPLTDNGEYNGIICTIQDVTESTKNKQELEKSERKYRSLVDLSPYGIATITTAGKVTWVNRAFLELTGYREEDFVGKHFTKIPTLMKQDLKNIFQYLEQVLKSDKNRRYVFNWKHFSGERRIGDARVKVIRPEHDKPFILAVIRDITEQIRAEEDLRKSLDEKDFLMKELNHRVKNNLAMILSLISLKDSALGESVDLSDLKNQIDAIRIVHEKLYQSEEIRYIDFRDYIDSLLSTIFSLFIQKPVRLEIEVEDINIPTRTAIPLGLIINEIATNAIKHGFTEIEEAVFSVYMEETKGNGRYTLRLSNTGRPFPEDIDPEQTRTLGFKLITALVEQLDGSLELERTPHPIFTIRFPAT